MILGFERQAFINIAAAFAVVFAADLAMGITYPLLSILLEHRGLSSTLIGINAAMTPLGNILASFFIPGLVERFGGRLVALIGGTLIIAALAGLMISSNFLAWCGYRFIFGIGVCALYTVSEAWVMIFTPNARRGRITAIYATLMALGFALGPFLLPFTGFFNKLPFMLAIAAMLISISLLMLVREKGGLFEKNDVHTGGVLAFCRVAPLLLLAVMTVTIFDSVWLAFFPVYGLRSGLDANTTSFLMAVGVAGVAMLQYPIGWLADRWTRVGVIRSCALTSVALAALLSLTINTPWQWPIAFFLGASGFSIYTLSLIIMGDNFTGRMLVAGSAATGAMWGLGGIGPPTTGLLIGGFGFGIFPWIISGLFAILLIAMLATGSKMVRAST